MSERKVFKYEIPHRGDNVITMPGVCAPLYAGIWRSGTKGVDPAVCLWALVDPKSAPRHYKVSMVWTGEETTLFGNERHLGTFSIGALVYHVFFGGPA